ncbi:hypothetical protein [Pseudomonas panipatensis]|uniref:hypothetical protein n=1 Tax=Pseudomonas panipatensis TaxID=428992 RepID=UPI001113A9F9|nr:hypothetical protein [Pseudomonas panipatensis]
MGDIPRLVLFVIGLAAALPGANRPSLSPMGNAQRCRMLTRWIEQGACQPFEVRVLILKFLKLKDYLFSADASGSPAVRLAGFSRE